MTKPFIVDIEVGRFPLTVGNRGTYMYEGFTILLSNGDMYQFGIDSEQRCCESFGYIQPNEDIVRFIGQEFRSIETICAPDKDKDFYHGGTIFIRVQTDIDSFDFTVYNTHNGWYGHDIVLVKNDEIVEEFEL